MAATAFSELLSRISRRGGVWLVIGVVHVALIYVITSGSPIRLTLQSTPLEASIIETPVQPTQAPPPPPVPQLERPVIPVMEQPLVSINEPPPPKAITVAPVEKPPVVVAAAPPAPHVVTDVAYIEPPHPKYPPESRRSGEEGLVILRVLIDEIGKVARIDIQQSSGHARLDDAACEAVKRARFRPYVENGVPRMALATIPIEFNWRSRHADRSGGRG